MTSEDEFRKFSQIYIGLHNPKCCMEPKNDDIHIGNFLFHGGPFSGEPSYVQIQRCIYLGCHLWGHDRLAEPIVSSFGCLVVIWEDPKTYPSKKLKLTWLAGKSQFLMIRDTSSIFLLFLFQGLTKQRNFKRPIPDLLWSTRQPKANPHPFPLRSSLPPPQSRGQIKSRQIIV